MQRIARQVRQELQALKETQDRQELPEPLDQRDLKGMQEL
jgi:hypothetical protein